MNILNKIKNLFNKYVSPIFNCDSDIVNYIFTNDSLPAPLDDDDEKMYIGMFDTVNDEYARGKLIEHNLRLVLYIAKKFETPKTDLEDLVSVGAIGLVKAVDSFKADKNIKLATYASRCIENEILMYLRKTQKSRNDYSLDEILSIDSDGNEMILADIIASNDTLSLTKLTEEEDVENLYFALNKLSKREREIIVMRFGLFGKQELTQKEVADLLGISQSYISRLEKRILDKMRNIIEERVKVA